MSASLKTTNYELGIYAPNDVTSWLTDFNGNMNKIDAQMKANANGVQGNVGDINALEGRMTTAENDIEQLENEYSSVVEVIKATLVNNTTTTNTTSFFRYVYKLLGDLFLGTIRYNIGKTGDELSTIEVTGVTGKFIPIINFSGNPFNLPIIASPNISDMGYFGVVNCNITASESMTSFNPMLQGYYNGTNTLLGFIAQNNSLTSATEYTTGNAIIIRGMTD